MDNHKALPALGTLAERTASEVFVAVAVVCFRRRFGMPQVEKGTPNRRRKQTTATATKTSLAVRSANVPNAGKATWWLSVSSRGVRPNRQPWIPHSNT